METGEGVTEWRDGWKDGRRGVQRWRMKVVLQWVWLESQICAEWLKVLYI